jgi:2Fe-2S ferredoxin
MPMVVYVLNDGSECRVDVPEGATVMRGAIQNNIKGIDAECGGSCSCATCHVYVGESHLEMLPEPDPAESAMLTGVAAERKSNSRLSCQITMVAALDGLVVRIPERQT